MTASSSIRRAASGGDTPPFLPSPGIAPGVGDTSLPRHPPNWRYGPVGDAIERARHGINLDAKIARIYDTAGLCETAIAAAGRRHHALLAKRDGGAA